MKAAVFASSAKSVFVIAPHARMLLTVVSVRVTDQVQIVEHLFDEVPSDSLDLAIIVGNLGVFITVPAPL